MKENTLFQKLKIWLGPPDGIAKEEFHFVRPFYLMVILMLAFVYVNAVLNNPSLQSWGPLTVFTILIALHAFLHWRSVLVIKYPNWDVFYILVQGIIALVIVYMVQELGLAFGVIAALIGESVGILRNRWKAAVVVVLSLLAGMFGVLALVGQQISPLLWLTAVPLIMFVVIYVEVFSRQTEAREEAQNLLKELEVAHEELGRYAAQVEELTLSQERQRIAYELHDTLGQGVAGLVLQLEAVKHHLETGQTGRAEEIVSQAMLKARNTLADSRAVIDDLRQMGSAPNSFKKMLADKIEDFMQSSQSAVTVEVQQEPDDLHLSEDVLYHAERIISESLFNVVQHAQAENLSIRVNSTGKLLVIEIIDDGVGFDREKDPDENSYGLVGMEERAKQLGGTFVIESDPGEGTCIKVEIPLLEETE